MCSPGPRRVSACFRRRRNPPSTEKSSHSSSHDEPDRMPVPNEPQAAFSLPRKGHRRRNPKTRHLSHLCQPRSARSAQRAPHTVCPPSPPTPSPPQLQSEQTDVPKSGPDTPQPSIPRPILWARFSPLRQRNHSRLEPSRELVSERPAHSGVSLSPSNVLRYKSDQRAADGSGWLAFMEQLFFRGRLRAKHDLGLREEALCNKTEKRGNASSRGPSGWGGVGAAGRQQMGKRARRVQIGACAWKKAQRGDGSQPGAILLDRGHSAASEDTAGCHSWGGGYSQHLMSRSQEAAQHPPTHRVVPTSRNHLVPNANRRSGEKSYPGGGLCGGGGMGRFLAAEARMLPSQEVTRPKVIR